jgi:cell wall-associated NlpC family hydrolase
MSKLKLLNLLKEEVTEQGYGRYFKDVKTSDGKTVGDSRGFDFTTNKPFEKDYKNPEVEVLPSELEDNRIAVGNKIIKSAESKIGNPYVWGGEEESEGGFDCSGFVHWTYNDAGIPVPRGTATSYWSSSKKLDKKDVMVGDLVFFDADRSRSGVDHIGIVHKINSDGTIDMIHSEGGEGVNIQKNILSGYYGRKLTGFGRVG